ncbi:MAG: hypothetical protein K0R15_972 [Clostridiales bacterium]|nr:hypothetical protein [Clostridiales bacterium]
MLFSSSIFLFLFLPPVLIIYYLLIKYRVAQNVFLLGASLFFYAWGEPKFVIVMIASIIINYVLGLFVDKYRENKFKSKLIIAITVVVNLSLMFIFKYLNFAIFNLNKAGLNIPQTNILLPIGISFFTFQALSYVIDVYRQDGKVQKNPLYVGLYIALFPQLIAGPIVRYETVADQILNRRESLEDFSKGCCRFLAGLTKKMLISNTMALLADTAFKMNSSSLTVTFAWLGAIAYTLQIYYDFSGYSDMAIGLGQMFGFKFLENFNYPYIAKSVSDFWRRWHISLSTWFRDYVYFPLGGSRVKSKFRLIFNLFIVWGLTGIWHGASWNFIAWGLFYFAILVIEKLTGFIDKIPKMFSFLTHIYALLAVIIGWVLFRAANLSAAIDYLKTMFGIDATAFTSDTTILYLKENMFYLLSGIIFAIPTTRIFMKYTSKKPILNKTVGYLYPVVYIILFIICTSYIVKGTYNPFIYFNF